MLMVQRDKPLRDYTSSDFVKYFSKKFQEKYKRDYSVIFARDCSIMLKVMHKFFEANVSLKDIFPFIDKMFNEYDKTRHRVKAIDMNWLYTMVDSYLKGGDKQSKTNKKVKTPEVTLDAEMKEWLKKEKQKWLK